MREQTPSPISFKSIVAPAIWIGAVTGWLEAGLTWGLRHFPAISAYHKSGIEVFWVAPLANIAVMLINSVAVAIAARLIRKIPFFAAQIGVLSFAGAYIVLSYARVIEPYGALFLSLGCSIVAVRLLAGKRSASEFFTRKILWPVAACLVVGLGAHGWMLQRDFFAVRRLPQAAQQSPNILVLLVDSLRGDRLSIAGYKRATSPNIDALANDGVYFRRAYSTAPWTTPSHATLMTGRYTHEHLVDYPVPNINHGFLQLPQVLARHGYRTALFSANLAGVSEEYLRADFQHFDTYTPFSTLSRLSAVRKFVWQFKRLTNISLPPPKRAPLISKAFLHWQAEDSERPYFALLNFIDVHDHIHPEWKLPPQFQNKFESEKFKRPRGNPPWGAEGQEAMDRFYDETIAYTDDVIGQTLRALKTQPANRKTLVILVSDHGEALGGHSQDGHASSLYLDQTHIPLAISFPGVTQPATIISRPVSLVNLPATILHLASLPPDLPGTPLPMSDSTPLVATRDALLAEYYTVETGPRLKSLLTSRWHYILDVVNGNEELFDLDQDPGELKNLAGAPDTQEILHSFRQEMKARFPKLPSPEELRTKTSRKSGN